MQPTLAEIPIALTVAGSDPSGGAGLQADLKTFHQHRVYGTSVVTLLTAQSTKGVKKVQCLSAMLVLEQLDVLLEDVRPAAAKTGALGTAELVEAVASRARAFDFPLVVDPVMVSKHGHPLMDDGARRALVKHLLPCAALVTPNAHEAALLADRPVETPDQALDAARAIAQLGPVAVLVKGGHLPGPPIDVLLVGDEVTRIEGERIESPHTHGTGCTLSAAITARLASGERLREAVIAAKRWLTEAIRHPPRVGGGIGPVNHFTPLSR